MKKSSKEKTACIYSDALYAAAKEGGHLQEVRKDVDTLRDILKVDADLLKAIASPLMTPQEQKTVLTLLGEKAKLQRETLQCLELMGKSGKLGDAVLMMKDFAHLCCQNNHIVEVTVETVKKLSSSQDKKLQEVLERRLNSKVALDYHVNPNILGGLRIQYGTYLVDASLDHKLNCLENVMKGK